MITRRSTREIPNERYDDRAPFDWNIFRRLVAYLMPYRRGLILMYSMAAINVIGTVMVPILIQRSIDLHIVPRDTEGFPMTLITIGAMLAAIYLSGRIQGILMMKIGYKVLFDLRRDLFNHLQRLSFRFFDTNRTGQIMSRLTNDVQVLEELLRAGLDTILVDVLMIFGIAGAMIYLDARLSMVLLITVPSFLLVVFWLQRFLQAAGRRIQRSLGAVNAFLNESISGIKVIRAFAREELNTSNFHAVNGEYYDEACSFYPLNAWFWQSVATLALLGIALVALGGGILLDRELITVGVIVAFLSYINRFFQPLQKISNMINQVSRAIASAERIFAMLDEPVEETNSGMARTGTRTGTRSGTEQQDRQGRPGPSAGAQSSREQNSDDGEEIIGQPAASAAADVRFESVSFGYEPNEPVLFDVSVAAPPGGVTAIVGETGSGKTTLINLICRFYEPTAGAVTLDGTPIRAFDLKHYRRQLALVAQDAGVFSGTIAENIRFGVTDAADSEVQAVAQKMGIHETILSLEHGYETHVGEKGRLLSLGQRQLVAFARALLRNPRILILDEASSYLDTATEARVQEAMKELSRHRTTFVIAHRLSTIREADVIWVVDEGRIIEQGSHDQLLNQGGRYAAMVASGRN